MDKFIETLTNELNLKIVFYRSITSLADSMFSMSLCDQVKLDTERLSTEKLNSLRDLLRNRKILQITPKRPERTGLSSEIVMEKRKAHGEPSFFECIFQNTIS